MTLLTIIVANYNNGHLLKQCISSILADAFSEEFEILIIDDRSTDNSLQIIQELSLCPKLNFYFKEQNGGVEAAFNTGIALARGEYLHLFAADDIYLPGALNIMLHLIKHHPNISLFSSDYTAFNTEKQYQKKMLPITGFRFFTSTEVYSLFRHTDFWLPGHTVFVKKSVYLSQPIQDKRLRSAADWFINHKIALECGVGYIPLPLIARRENGYSYSSSATLQEQRSMWLHLLFLLRHCPLKKFTQSGICRMLGLKAIYRDLLKTPNYWKYLLPMLRKALEKKFFNLIGINCNSLWIRLLNLKKWFNETRNF